MRREGSHRSRRIAQVRNRFNPAVCGSRLSSVFWIHLRSSAFIRGSFGLIIVPASRDRLTLQFLEWVSSAPRTYAQTMDAWRSTCPRLTVWEDAVDAGLVEIKNATVILTDRGRAVLDSIQRHGNGATPGPR